MGERKILVGVFGAAQGVRGEVRVKSFTAVPAAIGDYGPLASEDGARVFEVTVVRPLRDDMVVVRVSGVSDRDAAAALTGTRLYLDRDRLPPPAEDEVYHADLVGLVAEDEAGQALGRVVSVENYGGGDLLAIVPEGGGETLLVAFTRAFVPDLDLARGRLVVAAAALAGEDEEA